MHQFTRLTDESAFTRRHNHRPTTVYLLQPPHPHSSSLPWITARETIADNTCIFRHPLTSKPHSFNFPPNSGLEKLYPVILVSSHHFGPSHPVDKLHKYKSGNLLALYGGGQLQACPQLAPEEDDVSASSPWVKLSSYPNFDDIIIFRRNTYALNRQGWIHLIDYYKTDRKFKIGRRITTTVTPGAYGFGWRKRFAVDEWRRLYMVVRDGERSFRVYMMKQRGKCRWEGFYWKLVTGFEGGKVLFMGKDYYFFLKTQSKFPYFPGMEYKNCIVFSEAAFPQYGSGGWEFTMSDDRQLSEDDIAVFRFDDGVFAREGENSVFPKIDWSPPAWFFNVSSAISAEFQAHVVASEREPDVDEGLDSDSRNKNDGKVQSDLKDSISKDGEEQEEMVTDFGSQDREDEKMQCDSNSQGNKEKEMHTQANIEGDGSLQEDIVPPVPPPNLVESIRRALHSRTSWNGVVEQETPGKNITPLIHASTTESHKSDSPTTKFEGLDIRSDLIQTLQKIWQKHGNIIKESTVRSRDIVARALESLATMVRILEDNPAQSLSDDQADYLSSTLSDLKCIRFKVCWLVLFVEKVLLVHKSKPLVESLNNLSQLSSQVKERRAILLDEVAKLDEEQNKLKEEIANVSKMIPFSGQVKFAEPIGAGLT